MQWYTPPAEQERAERDERKADIEQILQEARREEWLCEECSDGWAKSIPYKIKVAVPVESSLFRNENERIAFRIAQIKHICQDTSGNEYDGSKRIELLEP